MEAAQIFGTDVAIERDLHAELRQPRAEIPQRLGELLLAGNAAREIELAADFGRRIEERHVVAALRRRHRARHSRGARADDGNLPLLRRGHELQFGLATRVRIHQARRRLPLEDLIEAGLIAADASVDLVGAIERGLVDEVRIGEERPRHRHHVGVAAREQGLGGRRIVDAVGRD